jgi:DNA repair protein SbcD/Mre11
MRVVHAADLHIDSQLDGISGLLAGEADADLIAMSTRSAFANLVGWAIDEQCDAMVLAGDVFDGQWKSVATRRVFMQGLADLHDAGIPVLMASGNHDAASVLAREMHVPPTTHVFPVEAPGSYEVPGLDLVVHGQGYALPAVTRNLVVGYPDPVPGVVNLGVLHANVGGSARHDNYAPCTSDDLQRLGYDYVALGHIHERTVFEADRVYAAYPGNLQGRSVRELGAKGALLVTLAPGAAPTVEFRALDVLRWQRIDVDGREMDSVDEVLDDIAAQHDALRAAAEGRRLVVRADVRANPGLHSRIRQEDDFRELVRDATTGSHLEKAEAHRVSGGGPSSGPVVDDELAAAVAGAARELTAGEVSHLIADVAKVARRQLKPVRVDLDDPDYLVSIAVDAGDDLAAALGGA